MSSLYLVDERKVTKYGAAYHGVGIDFILQVSNFLCNLLL